MSQLFRIYICIYGDSICRSVQQSDLSNEAIERDKCGRNTMDESERL